jgi:uncharacterized membrane protein YedE/YeeE
MITAEELEHLEQWVILTGLGLGLLLGWISRYAGFCTVGAITDWYASGDRSRVRMWLLAIGVAILGTQGLIAMGEIQVKDSFYLSQRLFWLSHITGGLLFGFGMVLASGCGARTLIRIGGGSLKALVVFLVMAVVAIITMRGLLGVFRVETLEKVFFALDQPQDLTSLLANGFGLATAQVRFWVTALILLVISIYIFISPVFRSQPRLLFAGAMIGALVVAAWWTTGHLGFVAEDPNTLEPRFVATNTRGIESLTFVAPLAYWLDLLMLWSDTSRTITFGIATVSGVVIGAFIHALATKTFRWEGFQNRDDLSRHLMGAALMGFGGVVAFGCTIGQGISGLSLLAVGSVITTVSIVAGAWAGLTWIDRQTG